jgi:aconitase A
MSVEDVATTANMAPEYGAPAASSRCRRNAAYLEGTGRPPELLALVEAYRPQGLFRTKETPD